MWEAGDTRPKTAVRVTGRLSSAGAGKFYLSGRIAGMARASCRRCLEDLQVDVDEDIHLLLVDGATDEADQPDVYLIDTRQRELDLRPAIREEWLLSVPQFTVCADTCQGLCPTCGANRNTGACSCKPAIDPQWSALSSLRDG
ncbi:MAG: YceD family protein [Gemmatimonadaceae bacterium]